VIGSVFSVPGSSAPGSVAAGGPSGRLLDAAGAALQALDRGRGGADRIRAALSDLRDALTAARAQADPVPGRTALKPVIAEIEQTVDKPTFVTIDGELVQSGTITVSLGPRPLVVGYERSNRAPLAVDDALNALASTVATLVATVGGDGTGGFAADVAALLRDSNFTTALRRPDAAAVDAALARIDATLARADGLRASLDARAAAAARVDLGGLLLGAGVDAGAAALATAGSLYQPQTGSPSGSQFSALA